MKENTTSPARPIPSCPLESRNIKSVGLVLHRMFPSNIALAPDDFSYRSEHFIEKWSEEVARKKLNFDSASDNLTHDNRSGSTRLCPRE